MAVTIGNNISSLNAQRQLGKSSAALASHLERLSSGMRINRASDDAAGLAIASSLNASVRVYGQAVRNVNDGISALNIADGAAGELSSIITRLKELATQGANGTLAYRQRAALNVEAQQLREEFNRLIQTTTFNGIKLVSDSSGTISIATGTSGRNGILDLTSSNLQTGNKAAGTFAAATVTDTGGVGRDLVNIDLNSDGKLDIVFGDYYGSGLSVLYGNGNGTFQAAKAVQGTSDWGQVQDLTLADVDGDGQQDIVTAGGGTGIVKIGAGGSLSTSFQDYTDPHVNGYGTAVALGDLNNDGKQDLVVGGVGGNVVAFLGNGNGTFKSAASDWARTNGNSDLVTDVAVGDFNGDGKQDIVATTPSLNIAPIFYGNGAGAFSAGFHDYFDFVGNLQGTGQGIALSDYNSDGKLDIAVGTSSGSCDVFLGNGVIYDYQSVFPIHSGESGNGDLLSADMNGDGKMDLVGSYSVLFGNGNGTFSDANYFSLSGDSGIAVGDYDGDGVLDSVSSESNGSNFYISHTNSISCSRLNSFSLATRNDCLAALDTLERAFMALGQARGRMGAEQSRLATSLNTIIVSRDNFEQSSARITNADIGLESAEMTRQGIIQQAAAAVLAQANQQPALSLRLLAS